MHPNFDYIIDRISKLNPLHAKKLKKNISSFDEDFFVRAEIFLSKYEILLKNKGKNLDYAADCYLQMLADINFESVQFLRSGEYTSKSFTEVNERVYNNPAIMEYYMHGLLLSQFLWAHHYQILVFFSKLLAGYHNKITNYLEIGGGHGLYISEANKIVGNKARYYLVDISKTSVEIAKSMIADKDITFYHTDVFEHTPDEKYDFITIGEVLEHMEDPVALLKKAHSLLTDHGRLFITTPTNAPAIDHIYLFKNAGHIREVIASGGFRVEKELCIYTEDVSADVAEKYKVSMMYAGLLTK